MDLALIMKILHSIWMSNIGGRSQRALRKTALTSGFLFLDI